MFWESHPYNWPVVGWPSDIPAITKAQADAYYSTYYSPQNITLVLVGNLDPEKVTASAERYFGRIPRGKNPVPDVVTLEVPQQAEKRLNAEAEANPQVDILWHTVPFGHVDSYPLQVLAQLLSTRTGRLYKGLVLGSQVATDAFARQESRKWAGLFNAGGEAKEGRRPEEVEQAIYAEIAKLQKDDVPADELQKVKNNFAAAEYRRLSSNFPILVQLIQNDGRGDWREVNEAGTKVQAVTGADVRRVANKYFTKENRAVAVYTRKAGAAGPEDPDLAGLDDRGKSMVRQVMQRLQSVDDPEKLRQMAAQMDSQTAAVPPEMKPAHDVVRKKVQERIDELEKAKGEK
jgi:predicted Zn-dependent peptidase